MASIERIRALLVGKTILAVEELDCDEGQDTLYPDGYTGYALTLEGQLGERTVEIILDFEDVDLVVRER